MSVMGNFLFICLICIAVFSFSASIETTTGGSAMNGRLMQEVVPLNYEDPECASPIKSIPNSPIFTTNKIFQ